MNETSLLPKLLDVPTRYTCQDNVKHPYAISTATFEAVHDCNCMVHSEHVHVYYICNFNEQLFFCTCKVLLSCKAMFMQLA